MGERRDDERTRVSDYKQKKKGDKGQLVYQRTFLKSETKEVRLFGLGGQDEFELTGDVNKGIKIRILGGRKKDQVKDQSNVSSGGKKTTVYDKSVEVEKSKETRVVLTKDNEANTYNRKSFKYDILMPQISANINPDDGLFLGVGFLYTKNNWRKECSSLFISSNNIKIIQISDNNVLLFHQQLNIGANALNL